MGRLDDSESCDAPDLARLEELLGHRFGDRSLLLRAVTHRSFAHEAAGACGDNEALEFLGDAILSFVVADRLFRRFPGLDEGRLSKHKSMLENLRTLAQAAREASLGDFLRLGRGELRSGGSGNEKILSDALEAVIAAVYLDGGLPPVERLVDKLLSPRMAEIDAENPVADFKSALQEATQARALGVPVYRVAQETGPDHQKIFHVVVSLGGRDLAEGSGPTKRAAQQVAARLALAGLAAETGDHPAS